MVDAPGPPSYDPFGQKESQGGGDKEEGILAGKTPQVRDGKEGFWQDMGCGGGIN